MRKMNNELKIDQEQIKNDERIINTTINADVKAWVKNGYENNIKDIRLNYSAGATLNVPIKEKGKRSKHKSLRKLEVNKAINTIELTKKEITSQVADSYLTLVSSFAKIEQLKVQANVSEQAYQQALVNYATGAITNLELLTSSTNATNSKLLLLQEEITYQIAYYRLLMDIGVKIY